MEDILKRYIYYRIFPKKEYYIIELQNDEKLESISQDKIKEYLKDEGFNQNELYLMNIKYSFDDKDKFNELNQEVKVPDNITKIYIELNISKENSIKEEKKEINEYDEYDEYQNNIDRLKREIDKISKDNYNININKKKELSKEGKFLKIYGINQNINFKKIKPNVGVDNNNSNNNKVINIYYLYSYPLCKENINNNTFNDNRGFQGENKVNDSMIDNMSEKGKDNVIINNNPINENKQKDDLINDSNIKNDKKESNYNYDYKNKINENNNIYRLYEDNICYSQIFSLYETIEESNIYANIVFEPIDENFKNYLEGGPDILHIKVNSFKKIKEEDKNDNEQNDNTNKLFFKLDLYGDLDEYSCQNLKVIFKLENNVSKIKLFILSSQNIEEFKELFKDLDIKNIIYINSSPLFEEEENIFITTLYQSLNGKTIQEAFDLSKNKIGNKIEVELITNNKDGEENNKLILFDDSNSKIINNKYRISLNKNCLLNLDYMKYNYSKYDFKISLIRNEELKECVKLFKTKNKVCVYGYEGVGKKTFVQKVGYYHFERKMFDNIYYFELYSLDDVSKKIFKYKIEEVLNDVCKDKDNENKSKKVLIIVFFNFIIGNVADLKILEQIINSSDDNFYFLYAFTISNDVNIEKIKENIKHTSIELKQLNKETQKKLLDKFLKLSEMEKNQNKKKFRSIKEFLQEKKIENYEKKEALENQNKNEIKNSTNEGNNETKKMDKCKTLDFLNDIRLKALFKYVNKNIEIEKISNLYILEKILNNKNTIIDIDIQKIFAIFSILKFGISNDILPFPFFLNSNKELFFITEKPNYLFCMEKNEEETIYYLDSAYIEVILNILIEKYENDLKKYLELIFKVYTSIFRYLINNSNFPYDIISMQFIPEINKDFCNKPNEISILKSRKPKIFFDDVLYSNNILFLLKKCREIINNNETFYNYIYQISIYLPIILHFKKSFIYRNLILDFFINLIESESFKNYKLEYKIRLKILKYWIWSSDKIEGNNKYIFDIEEMKKLGEDNKENNNKILVELILFKIYDYINKKKKENLNDVIEKCNKFIKEDDNFYLSRINLLYGIYTNDIENLKNAEKFSKKADNKYLELKSKMIQTEWKLKNNEFDNSDKEIKEYEEIIKNNIENDINLKNSDIKNELSNLSNLKNRLFNNYIKNMLFFFTSEPFYIENEDKKNDNDKYIALKTESNNDFYLKFNLSTALPNLKFNFQKIEQNLVNLKKCVQYPIKFLYIGSDYFNDKGNICYVDENFVGHFIDNKEIEKIIEASQCKKSCDIVILGVLNSENGGENSLVKIFESKNFRHIIYIKTIESLTDKLKEYPFLYFYFQKAFFNFVKEFIIKISNTSGRRLSIKESFRKVNNSFNEAINKIISFEIDTKKTPSKKEYEYSIIQMIDKPESDDDICDFNYFNEENNNSNINKIIHSNEKDMNDDDYDNEEYKKQNYIYFRNNPFKNVLEQKDDKKSRKKNRKYYKFPGKGNLRKENFEKGFFSMKDILKEVINTIKNNKYINLFGNIFKEKRKICEEAYKYFYMNGFFKKGIFIVDIKNINSITNLLELESHISKIKKPKDTKDMLIAIENVDKLDNNLCERLEKLEIHTLFISKKQLDKNNWLNNDNCFYDIDKKTEEYKKNNPSFEKEYKRYEDIKFVKFSY